MKIRQSDLSSFARCANQVRLKTIAAQQGQREDNLSATAFGTVIHHAAQVMEEEHHAGNPDACEIAVKTFEYYWDPGNIQALVPGGIDQWLPRQNQGGLLIRGRDNLRAYYQHLTGDTGKLLALEHQFTVPIEVMVTQPMNGPYAMGRLAEWHELTGTADRLALRVDGKRKPYLSIDDFKSGQKPTYLRHALQWSVYGLASLHPDFWAAWPADDLELLRDPLRKRGFALFLDGSGMPVIPRRGRWIALRDAFGVHDAGWRTEADFERVRTAVGQYIAAVRADIYPLSPSGQTCTYCPFLYSGDCGGLPHDSAAEGAPYPG